MSLQVFVFLPDSEESILEISDRESNFKGSASELLRYLRKRQDVTIFYDEENIKTFLDLYGEITGETYLHKPKDWLYHMLGKTALTLKENSQTQSDCLYLWWRIEDLSVSYANVTLSGIAERIFTYPNESYLLLNIGNALPSERGFLTIFKDAKHLPDLPDKFAHIPFVIDKEALDIWLAKNHQPAFSLSDSNRFQRTSQVYQGKPVFEERKTGYFWYLDNFHKLDNQAIDIPRHYEVFDAQRQHIGIADLQGTLDLSKRIVGRILP